MTRNSDHDRDIWRRLIARLGGESVVARSCQCTPRAIYRWVRGDRNCPSWQLARLIALYDDRSEHDLIRSHLVTWKAAADERREYNRGRLRERFVERFGHYPDDPNWQRQPQKPPTRVLDPDTNQFREIPQPIVPRLPSKAQLRGIDVKKLEF